MQKSASVVFLTLLLLLSALFPLAGFVSASREDMLKVTIGEDGKIEPPTAPITNQGNIYTLTGELSNTNLDINCSGVLLNGANFTVYGRITINGNYVTVMNTTIDSGSLGILVLGNHGVISNNIFYHNLADMSIGGDYTTVIGNNDTGGAYRVFYVNSNYNNLTKNQLKGIEIGGDHNIVANNTVEYLYGIEGKNNTSLNNMVDGQLQTITPQPTFPTVEFETTIIIVIALIICIIVAFAIYRRTKTKKQKQFSQQTSIAKPHKATAS